MDLLQLFFYIIQFLKQGATGIFRFFVAAPYNFIYPFARYVSSVLCGFLAHFITLLIYVIFIAALFIVMCKIFDTIFGDSLDIMDF